MEAGDYYTVLRRQLPDRLLTPADAFLGTIHHGLGETCPKPPHDLFHDTGGELPTYDAYYSMRPETVRQVHDRGQEVPWTEIEGISASVSIPSTSRHDVCDFDHFRGIVGTHQDWLREAAETGRGLIVLISQ